MKVPWSLNGRSAMKVKGMNHGAMAVTWKCHEVRENPRCAMEGQYNRGRITIVVKQSHEECWDRSFAVSYTHLTLPTICSV